LAQGRNTALCGCHLPTSLVTFCVFAWNALVCYVRDSALWISHSCIFQAQACRVLHLF
jgi:hypothetical protein